MPETKRDRLNILYSQLHAERSSFISHWRDLSDYILPRRAQFTLTNVNRGEKKNQNIVNSTATFAQRTLKSGLVSGITSPARPWFELRLEDRDMTEFGPVKTWLSTVSRAMLGAYRKSNFYQVAPIVYGDIGVFGTGAYFVDEDFETVARFYPMPIGSYYIANDSKLRVRVFMREMLMTVRQVVEKFGTDEVTREINWDNISTWVKNAYDKHQYETWVYVRHAVYPNADYNPKKLESKYKKYSSVYYETGGELKGRASNYLSSGYDKLLSEKGYDYFPVLVPRWEITGFDVYGTDCPGMTSLGDTKALQKMERRKAEAIEKMVRPAMTGPASLKNKKASILPGDITYVDDNDGRQGFKPAYQVDPRIEGLILDINNHEARIKKAFYEDIFLMMSSSDRREITATEITERREEKLIALGSVYDRINEDMLDPMTEIMFSLMVAQNRLPTPPPELSGGQQIKVEYVSIMAQAQKLLGLSSLERFSGFVANIAAQTQDITILDKVDTDQLIDVYGDRLGVDPSVVRSDEDVAIMRQSRIEKQQEQEQLAQLESGAKISKDLAGAKLEDDSALSRIMAQANAGR